MSMSCKETCKKTAQLKDSSLCSGFCSVKDGKIAFGCEGPLSKSAQAEQNFLTCSFWDMGIKENCAVCPLDCKENKNPSVGNLKSALKNVASVLESIAPLMQLSGMDTQQLKRAYDTMNSPDVSANMSKDIENTIKITNYAREVLNSAMSGGNIDIAEFKKVKELLEKKYRK